MMNRKDKNTRVKVSIVGGCGHVGLPLGVYFATHGNAEVTLIDKNEAAVNTVNKAHFPFMEKGGDAALKICIGKTLRATLTAEAVAEADFVILVTGTPVDEHLNPRISDVIAVVEEYLPLMHAGQTMVLRSTVYPGTSEVVWNIVQSRKPGVGLAFCPERVAQGYALEETPKIPQIVSAFERESEDLAAELFGRIAPEVLRLTPKEAELTKLFANSWRYLTFAIANQFYMIAEGHDVDFERIYHALKHNYERGGFVVHPGFTAGPCLFKDTIQLSAYHSHNFFLGHAAMLVNEGMPAFVADKLEKRLGTLAKKKIGILGMAFKANHDDTRESLSYKLKKLLEQKMAIVMDTDVYQPSHANLSTIMEEADGIILGVPHNEYRDLKVAGIPFVDCWGVWEEKPNFAVSPLTANPNKKAA